MPKRSPKRRYLPKSVQISRWATEPAWLPSECVVLEKAHESEAALAPGKWNFVNLWVVVLAEPSMFDLRIATPNAWLEVVLSNFDAFLLDHAACERKAFSTGMSFVSRYPDRKFLIEPMIEFAREELDHFHRVYRIIDNRGLTLQDDYKDVYVNSLLKQCLSGKDALLVDRLLIAGIVEARSCERLLMVAEGLRSTNSDLSEFYFDLGRAESRHHALFFRLARHVFSETEVRERADSLLDFEATLVQSLPHRAAVH